MSRRDYSYVWSMPDQSYDPSYDSSHYSDARDKQSQLHYNASSRDYQKPFTSRVPASADYDGTYNSKMNPDTEHVDSRYFSNHYSLPSNCTAPYQSDLPNPSYNHYEDSQSRHNANDANGTGRAYSSSYYAGLPHTPEDSRSATVSDQPYSSSNQSYGRGFSDYSYSLDNNLSHTCSQQLSSYDKYPRPAQYPDAAPISSTRDVFYGGVADNEGVYPPDDRILGSNSIFPHTDSPNTQEVQEIRGDYASRAFQTNNESPYTDFSYHAKAPGFGRYSNAGFRQQGEERPNRNIVSRGARGGGSASYPSKRGGTFHSHTKTANKQVRSFEERSHGPGFPSEGKSRNTTGNQVSSNVHLDNSTGRNLNTHSPSARSRGSSHFPRGPTGLNRGSNNSSLVSGQGNFHNQSSNFQSNHRSSSLRKPVHGVDKSNSKNFTPQNSMSPQSGSHTARGRGPHDVVKADVKEVKMKMKEEIKTPSRPQDKLLNEIEEKEKEEQREKERKAAEEKEKAELARKSAEEARKAEEEAQLKIMEEARKKAEEMAKKLAPPGKPPETPEEIAKEEEIQRKIRESVVIVDPEKEMSLLNDDPTKEIEMPSELRELLKSLTSDNFCKLCSLRMVGPHMAPMHYNGKNHLKKVKTFVQTNGRSAGFNMETGNCSEESSSADKKEGETEKEADEEVDETKYCKICKVSFSHGSQYEMHYKGKNHAKKVRSLANSSEIFECKICCVTVTAQEHLTAHLNGARHKLQLRKNNRDNMRGRGGFYTHPGRGGLGPASNGTWKGNDNRNRFDGRGRGRDRGGSKSLVSKAEEELYDLLGLTPEKRFRFDIANFQTPSGSFYCSHCDITQDEEHVFLHHLGSKKHQTKMYCKNPGVKIKNGKPVGVNGDIRKGSINVLVNSTDVLRNH